MEARAFLNQSFPRDHLFSRINISPAMAHKPDVWLLGSSLSGARPPPRNWRCHLRLRISSGPNTRAAFEHYFEAFHQPRNFLKPRAIMAIGVLCAPTQESRLSRRVRRRDVAAHSQGIFSPIPTPEDALPELADGDYGDYEPGAEFPRFIRGTPEAVRMLARRDRREAEPRKMMVITMVHDHQMRRRSYELLAKAAGLTPRS